MFIPYCFDGATFDVESGQDMPWLAVVGHDQGTPRSFLNADVKSYALADSSGNSCGRSSGTGRRVLG